MIGDKPDDLPGTIKGLSVSARREATPFGDGHAAEPVAFLIRRLFG